MITKSASIDDKQLPMIVQYICKQKIPSYSILHAACIHMYHLEYTVSNPSDCVLIWDKSYRAKQYDSTSQAVEQPTVETARLKPWYIKTTSSMTYKTLIAMDGRSAETLCMSLNYIRFLIRRKRFKRSMFHGTRPKLPKK